MDPGPEVYYSIGTWRLWSPFFIFYFFIFMQLERGDCGAGANPAGESRQVPSKDKGSPVESGYAMTKRASFRGDWISILFCIKSEVT